MPSRPQNFKKSDTQRLIRSAEEAGLRNHGVVLDGARVILQIGGAPGDNGDGDQQQPSEWDKAYGTEVTKVRPVGTKPKR